MDMGKVPERRVPSTTAAVDGGRYPLDTVGRAKAEWVWRELWTQARTEGCSDEVLRLAAIVGVVRASGAGGLAPLRRAEVLATRCGAYRPRARKLLVVRSKWKSLHTVDVADDLHVVLAAWLKRRAALVAEHIGGGAVEALFVTVHHTKRSGGVIKQVGLPLDAPGLLWSWKRWATGQNVRHAGELGWEALPMRFEQVRRAWWQPSE
ncbi:tyrosine-type recombinase/integrase [Streptomyces sp. NPDC001571]